MTLANFFAPLSVFNLLFTFFVFYQLEIVGFFIAKKLKFDEYSRFAWWILGLGVFVFLWFVLHFLISFNSAFILLSLVSLSSLTFPYYVNHQAWKSLIKSITSFPLTFLLLLIVIKRLSYWLSVPPYSWDEMAYHYYPVSKLFFENKWPFGLYEFYTMLPRFFETSFALLFSVTRTQVAARLIHFGIFFSILHCTAQFLKKRVSTASAVVFTISALFLNTLRLREATSGYIDVGVASLLLMAMFSLLLLIYEKKSKHLLALAVWLSLALAAKYSVLLSAVSIVFFVLVFFIRDNFSKITRISKGKILSFAKFILLLSAIAFVFGGFWYFKNLLYTYNPIYPFFFPCRAGLNCGNGQSFFEGWTTAFTWENRNIILLSVFQENPILLVLTVLSALAAFTIAFATKHKFVKIFLSVLVVNTFLEVLIASRITGYLGRYFLHWSLYIPLFLALPWMDVWKKWPKDKVLKGSLIFLLFFLSITQLRRLRPMVWGQIEVFNRSEKFLPSDVKAYGDASINIYDWIKIRFPDFYQVIYWCGDRNEQTTLVMADPQLIWTSHNGLSRAYFIYCQIDADLLNPDGTIKQDKIDNYIQNEAYLTSLATCGESMENPFLYEIHQKYYDLNQQLVCSADEIVPHVYKLKNFSRK